MGMVEVLLDPTLFSGALTGFKGTAAIMAAITFWLTDSN